MKYDLDRLIDRKEFGSLKWDVAEGELPMWVADMDFASPPAVVEEISRLAAHGVYGYAAEGDWTSPYISWWRDRHGETIRPEELVFSTGVIPVLSSAVRTFSRPAEKVLIMTPVYNIFYNCIRNSGRRIEESELVYEGGSYHIDFDDLEKKLSDPYTSMMFLCNPANPTGNIWSREELSKIGHLAKKHSVIVISDEIHCDVTDPGYEYVPFLSCGPEAEEVGISAISPAKAFNLGGIQTAACYSHNENLRWRIWRQLNTDECGEGNVFAYAAARAAFTGGGEWLDEVREYIYQNKLLFKEKLESALPDIHVVCGHATYLAWVDVAAYMGDDIPDSGVMQHKLRQETGLFVSKGGIYGGDGEHFLRVNLATPRARVEDGISRLISFFSKRGRQ